MLNGTDFLFGNFIYFVFPVIYNRFLQKDCGVDHLKMSDYVFTQDEFQTLAENARATMGGLFASDPVELSKEDCVKIFELSFR